MRILIYGSKDFALTVAELVRHCGHEAAGFVDDFDKGQRIIGTLEEVTRSHPRSDFAFALAIGYSNLVERWRAWERLRAAGYAAPALVHPRGYVADSARLGEGCMVMAGALVDVRACLGAQVVLWPGACVNHDASIGDNTFVSPNATICGHTRVGANCFIGAGSTIADHCEVPAASVLKMQSKFSGRTT